MVLPGHAVRAYAGGAPAAGPAPRRPRRAAAVPSPTPPAALAAHEAPRENCVVVNEYRRNVGVCLVNSEGLVFCAR